MSTPQTKRTTLMSALLAVQQEMPKLTKDSINEHFRNKYVSVDTIMAEILPVLNKHGLVWITLPGRDQNGDPALTYRLVHAETGEAIDGTMPLMLVKSDPQGQGSAITYARRYSITSVLGLSTGEDDDGHAASKRQATNGASALQARAQPAQQTDRPATAKQRGLIYAKASEIGMPASFLANVVLVATGNEAKEFADEDAAAWLKRALDRLPAKSVDPILKAIESEQVTS